MLVVKNERKKKGRRGGKSPVYCKIFCVSLEVAYVGSRSVVLDVFLILYSFLSHCMFKFPSKN